MIDNTALLQQCITLHTARISDSAILHRQPVRLPADFDFQKVDGMLLGLAVVDALGEPTEGMDSHDREARYGEVRDYLPAHRKDLGSIGAGTDDTQLAFWSVERLIEDGGLVPDSLLSALSSEHIVGIGGAVHQSLANYREGLPWQIAGVNSMGNGALMRIAPVILRYLQHPHPSLYADAALGAMITHNSPGNLAACVAFIDLLWQLLARTSLPEPEWWIETFCSTVRDLEGGARYAPRAPAYAGYSGPLAPYVREVCLKALERRTPVVEACSTWYSGAYLMETVPSALYILALHGHDVETAIIRAVNDTRDNDSIAAIVGAAAGALHGLAGIPDRWLKELSGRIRAEKGEHIFRLLVRARRTFWLKYTS